MTRALWVLAWALAAVAVAAFLLLWREAFAASAIASALVFLTWGFRLHPEPADYATNHRIEVDQ